MAARRRLRPRTGSAAGDRGGRTHLLRRALFRAADAPLSRAQGGSTSLLEYQWRRGKALGNAGDDGDGRTANRRPGIARGIHHRHYWGYTARRSGSSEYRVEHPRWRFWTAETTKFEADVATLYGPHLSSAGRAARPAYRGSSRSKPSDARAETCGSLDRRRRVIGYRLEVRIGGRCRATRYFAPSTRAGRTAKSRRGGSSRSRSAYRSAASPEPLPAFHPCA